MVLLIRSVKTSMSNWQVTATTVYCDAVDDEVTILVYKDWSVKCTGCARYSEPGREILNLLKKKGKQLKRPLKCEGLQCSRVVQYLEKLSAEEVGKGHSGDGEKEIVTPPQGDIG